MKFTAAFSALLIASSLTVASTTSTASAVSVDSAAPSGPISWIAVGDSYSAGIGLGGAGRSYDFGQGAQSDAKSCDQSVGTGTGKSGAAWPVLAWRDLESTNAVNATLTFKACSGDTTKQISGQFGASKARYDLVTMTAGGDDVQFVPVFTQCVAGDLGLELAKLYLPIVEGLLGHTIHGCPSDSDVRSLIARTLGGGYYKNWLAKIVRDHVDTGGNVVVMGYPDMLETPSLWNETAKLLGLCDGISPTDAALIRGWAADLNATIGSAVTAVNAMHINDVHARFVNVDDGSANANLFEPSGSTTRHNLCGSSAWLFGVSLTRGFHPNQAGQDAYARLMVQVIKKLNWSQLTAAPTATPKWSAAKTIDGGEQLNAVSCPSSSMCAAVDNAGRVVMYESGMWSKPQVIDSGSQLTGVSCSSSRFCAAVDAKGNVLTYNGAKWSAPDEIDAGNQLDSVSCPTKSFCTAVDTSGNILSNGSGHWSKVDATGNLLGGVSCPTSSFCEADGYDESGGNVYVFNGGSWSGPTLVDPGYKLHSIACASASFCVAGASVNVFTYEGGSWSAPDSVDLNDGTGFGLPAVACPTATFCATVDGLGNVLTYANGSWSSPLALEATQLDSISCPSASFCAVVDDEGHVLIFS